LSVIRFATFELIFVNTHRKFIDHHFN
jgi:hypothetical protein